MIRLAPFAAVGMALFVALGAGLVMWLWNWLAPPLFGLPRVTFWQALGLLALCRILFGGLGLRDSGRSHWRRHREEVRREDVTPEEFERLRQRVRERHS